MARLTLSIDTSDCSAVIEAVAAMVDRLPWPAREEFQNEVQWLIDAGKAVAFLEPKRGAVLEAIAAPELLDLMRKYEGRHGPE